MPTAAGLYYEARGQGSDGPAVVLIHGAGGTHLYWPPEVRRLTGCRLYAPDLPGHGKSAGPGMRTVGAYAGALLGWLDSVELPQAVLVGHSLGSAIALTLALDHPQRVQGLGLVGAAARLFVHPDILASASSPATFRQAVARIIQWGFSPQAPPRLVELAARRMAETSQPVYYGDFLAAHAFDVTERLDQIIQPTLVIAGAQDRLTPPRLARSLAERIPNAWLEIIPAAGHMVMLEKPGAVAGALKAFLDAL